MLRPAALLILFGLLWAVPAAGQDVEALGARYGTRPPQAYYETLARDPGAFQFSTGRTAAMRARMSARPSGGAAVIGRPQAGPVTGTFRIPVILALFQDSPQGGLVFTPEEVAAAHFGTDGQTVRTYYREASGGRVDLIGEVTPWTRADSTRLWVTNSVSGLGGGHTREFVEQLVAKSGGLDWSAYDNDGPDGVANSGDDDGLVDVVAVLQPTPGAECGGIDQDNRIWSHRWSLGSPYQTDSPSANGGFIGVSDYVIEPIFSCNGSDLVEIGVFTHELGHAFGLPDLYDTWEENGKHGGAGVWGLMSSGSWGCDGDSPQSPCHLSAWSKAELGWANVTTLAPDTDFGTMLIPPVETTGEVYRIDSGDGSEDYFLLENRQRLGFDQWLFGEGLLIWHIDPVVIRANWGWNRVNANEHMGVWLRQADGFNELGQEGGGRGDRDDPFPYTGTGGPNRVFHAASNPAARSHAGGATGLTVLDIERVGDDISLRLLTRFSSVTVQTTGDGGAGGLLTVDGTPVMAQSLTLRSAPFEEHQVEASAGEPLGQGRRRAFEGWDDDATAPRDRSIVTPLTDMALTARYGKVELELLIEMTGGVGQIEPGTIRTQPASEDLWFEEGAEVEVEAVPRTGFGFLQWTGALAGQSNPATWTMAAPTQAGADFEITYEVPTTTLVLPAATAQGLQLTVENGNAPVTWVVVDGALPPGLSMSPAGLVTGAALEMGAYSVTLDATDAIGLTGRGTVTFQVGKPELPLAQLASDFLSVGAPLNGDQRRFLDGQGNKNGSYDLGDFRAWVLANPDLPFSAALRALVGPQTVTIPTAPVGPGSEGGR